MHCWVLVYWLTIGLKISDGCWWSWDKSYRVPVDPCLSLHLFYFLKVHLKPPWMPHHLLTEYLGNSSAALLLHFIYPHMNFCQSVVAPSTIKSMISLNACMSLQPLSCPWSMQLNCQGGCCAMIFSLRLVKFGRNCQGCGVFCLQNSFWKDVWHKSIWHQLVSLMRRQVMSPKWPGKTR